MQTCKDFVHYKFQSSLKTKQHDPCVVNDIVLELKLPIMGYIYRKNILGSNRFIIDSEN